jgi:hypothetical protein
MSKGHKRRPRAEHVTPEELAARWDATLPRRSIPICAKCGRRHRPACEMTASEALDVVQRAQCGGGPAGGN